MKKILSGAVTVLLMACTVSCIKENENPASGTPSPLTTVSLSA